MNCLNQAIAEERIHQVRLLLSLNVDSETRDKKDLNRTPLLKASRLQCEDSSEKIMRILIRFGVSVNAVDDEKRTALHYACSDGKSRVIELLLKEHSIKLNEQDSSGQTPLMLAAINGQLRAARTIASRLIKFDIDIDVRDNEGYTALLHAIINQNYGIAYDLIKYANASSTIRDYKNFKNATEWLKKTVDDKQKQENQNRSRKTNLKAIGKGEKSDQSEDDEEESLKDQASCIPSAIPLLKISNLPGSSGSEAEIPKGEYSLARMVAETSKSKPLSERDIFQEHSRPSSAARSKASLSSAKNRLQMPVLTEQGPPLELKTRPSTAADDASVYSCNVSQGSRLGDDLLSTPGRSLFSSSNAENTARNLGNSPKPKLSSARKSARLKNFKIDLGQINISPSECSYPPTISDKIFSSGDIKDLPTKDTTRDNLAAIEALKQTLKKQKKNKVSRTSTSLSLSQPQKEETKSIHAQSTARTGSATTTKEKNLLSSRLTTEKPKISMRRFLSKSSVLSEDFHNPDHLDPGAIEQAKKNMETIFSLYTESLLWTPVPKKPESLFVDGTESDKQTLTSDFTTSVSDLASIIERSSIVQSEDGNSRATESKPLSSRSRLVSATSRASKKSARVSSSRATSAIRS